MQQGKNHKIGAAGHTYVKAQFEELGWGVNNNYEHDLGTDLWVIPQDERDVNLLSIAGVQVKTSADKGPTTYFKKPVKAADGSISGWWYYDSDSRHFDYWTAHAAPHILVLHDLSSKESYWVHIVPDLIEPTGKGSQIFVPSTQLVNAAHNRSLIEVATSKRPAPLWEGSAWNEDQKIQKNQQLRYALLTPRLIAPHQNGLPTILDPEQALASLVLLRSEVLVGRCPALESENQSGIWEWKFVAALSEYLVVDDSVIFGSIWKEATHTHQIAAAACTWAAALMEHGEAQHALEVVDETILKLKHESPQDHAWLQVQRSRCLLELGKKDTAKSAAINAYLARSSAPDDPTLTAISGVAALILFALSPFGEKDVRLAISNSDTLAGWWRNQVSTLGLAAHFESEFTDWSRDPSTTISSKDVAWSHLRAAALLSSLIGDQSAWRHASGRLAKLELMRSDEHSAASDVAESLSRLRRSGDHKAVKNSTRKIVLDGPAISARLASGLIDLDQSTRTTLQADMTMLEMAADVLEPGVAAAASRWCINGLGDIEAFHKLYDPTFYAPAKILDLLAAIVHVLDDSGRQSVMSFLVALPPQPDQLIARGYAKVFKTLNHESWTNDQVVALGHCRKGDHNELSAEIDRIMASARPASRNELLPRIQNGDITALVAFGDVRDLTKDALAGMRGHLAVRVRGLVQEDGAYSSSTPDPLYVLALLNSWHPLHADWQPVLEILEAEAVHPNYLAGALENIALSQDLKFPEPERAESALRRIMKADTDVTNVLMQMISPTDIRGLAAEALDSISPDSLSPDDLWPMLRGVTTLQVSAVRILIKWGRHEDFGLLVVLSGAEAQEVRMAVALGLADWISRDVLADRAMALLQSMLQNTGTRLAINVAHAAADKPDANASNILQDVLRDYPSARVRNSLSA